jgi:hypothetical protein
MIGQRRPRFRAPTLPASLSGFGRHRDYAVECSEWWLARLHLVTEAAEGSEALAAHLETESVLAVLERNRRTFAWKTAGLDEAGLRATTAAAR